MPRSTRRKFAANFLFLPARKLGLLVVGPGLAAIALSLPFAGPCPAAETAGGTKSDRAVAAPAAPSASRPDEAERRKVIESPAWRVMQHDLKEWLSVEQVYTPSQLRKVKAELNAKVAKMSPQELVDFMNDMEAKLKILMSPEAEKARLWMEQRIAVQVLTPEQLKRMRPDVLNMTSAQLEERLMEWEQQRKQTVALQQAFDKGRQNEVKNIVAMEKDEERERDQALNRAYESMDNGSPYGSLYNGSRASNPAPGYYGMYGSDYFGYYGGGYW
ncbi:MAG TPA: hypothetical protein VHY91_10260 [Pirellulales bacterium]|jgi:hypothetical protein|nr:hypothetical protein [Pirellulales bacterium]